MCAHTMAASSGMGTRVPVCPERFQVVGCNASLHLHVNNALAATFASVPQLQCLMSMLAACFGTAENSFM